MMATDAKELDNLLTFDDRLSGTTDQSLFMDSVT